MRKGQVWIETVLYTLIGLALVGMVLAIASPKINEMKDRITIDQTIESLYGFDQKVLGALDGTPGNVRRVDAFNMKRGSLNIDRENDRIYYFLEGLDKPYSQPGEEIRDGRITILTEEKADSFDIKLILDYNGLADIEIDGDEDVKRYSAASVAYVFSITNLGDTDVDGMKELSVKESSER